MPKTLLVTKSNGKKFRIIVPDEAKVTFGPWSPPSEGKVYTQPSDKALNGTLRVYETSKTGASILGVFSGVISFRDESLEYEEEIITEEVSTIWKSDNKGYRREEAAKVSSNWEQIEGEM